MSPALIGTCPKCGVETAQRKRSTIADVVATVAAGTMLAGEMAIRMMWVEDELRGICCDCTLARVTAAHEERIEQARIGSKR